ncbi:MAG: hypothetical protein GY731_19220, partial [Gammaproteobacteria bacterium]|nr:hypothetical protein [Gammaproteobacteria bacterium]
MDRTRTAIRPHGGEIQGSTASARPPAATGHQIPRGPLRTVLYDAHIAAGGRMVDFAGWEMPLHYGSQIREHHQVRR